MNDRHRKIHEGKGLFSKKRLVVMSIILLVVVAGFLILSFFVQNPNQKFSLKVAVIDQLGGEFPNSDFRESGVVTNIFDDIGFDVSYYGSEVVDVDFYRGLAKHKYGIILLRAHLATREGKTIVDLFTSEEYSEFEYRREQKNNLVTKGYYSWRPGEYYFAIAPKFVENLDGSFPKSIVIVMGCNSLDETCTEMAKAFIGKGATAYIGWTGLVQPTHTDNETIKLLRIFLIENKTLSNAVDAIESDSIYGSRMEYYPSRAGNLTITSLISEAKGTPISQSSLTVLRSIFVACIYRTSRETKRPIQI